MSNSAQYESYDHGQSSLTSTFDKAITEALQEWHVPSMSVAVIKGNKTFAKVGSPISLLSIPNNLRATDSRNFQMKKLHPIHSTSLPVQQNHSHQIQFPC
jgi:hypothetical protein